MLAGCSVHFDRMVLLQRYPQLKDLIGHKTMDVTSLLEAARRWRPDATLHLPPPSSAHRAMPDTLETIGLAKTLWKTCFLR